MITEVPLMFLIPNWPQIVEQKTSVNIDFTIDIK